MKASNHVYLLCVHLAFFADWIWLKFFNLSISDRLRILRAPLDLEKIQARGHRSLRAVFEKKNRIIFFPSSIIELKHRSFERGATDLIY